MTEPWYFWAAFGAIIIALLALDLGVVQRKSHTVSFREALGWTITWVVFACLFGVWVWISRGQDRGMEFFAGYLIELSLSADNVFVFVLIFGYFAVPKEYQHKVLFLGVLSAIVMRFVMIAVGAKLLQEFAWLIYVFGGFLIFTGIKLLATSEEAVHPERNFIVRWFRRAIPTTHDYHGPRFFWRDGAKLMATPLLVVLVTIEVSDLIFALDSIPAIFAVTSDSFIVFTSNVFAILGLRSLYFLLAGVMGKFHFLRAGLGLVLAFVGVKMLLGHTQYKIATHWALVVVALILTASIVASLVWPKRIDTELEANPDPPLESPRDEARADS